MPKNSFMGVAQQILTKSWKKCGADAPYCRDADWWKVSEQSWGRHVTTRRADKRSSYQLPKRTKAWSIVLFSGKSEAYPSKLEREFHALVQQWKTETSFHSSLGEVFMNDSYQRIMAMGPDALPLILSDLKKSPSHWFYALEKIVGKDIPEGAKTFAEARAAWLAWGHKHNYL